ncbi:MAG: C-terminal helicase domain-containing protein, partial [Gemmatimonadales bacterium]
AARLVKLLRGRTRQKTLVFTTAVATALDLARRLGWRYVAVVGGGRAWIASGSVTTETALGLFAPRARGARKPSPTAMVSTLIATDLASEGLDLQDADGVVHYDLPWTPLRLAQRLGRISRLGSSHDTAHVWWFAPPVEIERHLTLAARIAAKGREQRALGIAATSAVGRAQIFGTLAEWREMASGVGRPTSGGANSVAVVRGPLLGLVAIEWRSCETVVREVIAVDGRRPDPELPYGDLPRAFRSLAGAAPSENPAPPELIDALSDVLRRRMERAQRRPVSPTIRGLRRKLLRLGRRAARRRAVRDLRALDRALDATTNGLSVGNERSLASVLSDGGDAGALEGWLSGARDPPPEWSDFRILASLFGDGSST